MAGDLPTQPQALLPTWMSHDPWLLLAGAGAAVACLLVRPLRVLGIAFVAGSLPVLKPGGYLPSMYVIAALPFAALALAGLADAAFSWLSGLDALERRRDRFDRVLRRLRGHPAPAACGRQLAALVLVVVSLPLSIPLAVSYVRHEPAIQQTPLVADEAGALAYVDAHVNRRARILTRRRLLGRPEPRRVLQRRVGRPGRVLPVRPGPDHLRPAAPAGLALEQIQTTAENAAGFLAPASGTTG